MDTLYAKLNKSGYYENIKKVDINGYICFIQQKGFNSYNIDFISNITIFINYLKVK